MSTAGVTAGGSARPGAPSWIPGRSLLNWTLAFGFSRGFLHLAARRGDLLARVVSDPRLREDPFGAYDALRERGPVVAGTLASASAGHSAARQILRSEAFGVADGHGELPPRARRLLNVTRDPKATGPVDPPSMLAVDPPTHERYRRLVSRVFTPRAVAGFEARIERVAGELLDGVAATGAHEFDLVERYAARLPVAVIAEILGVPAEMHDRLLRWGDAGAAMLEPGLSWREYRRAERGVRELHAWFERHVADLRRRPGDDLLSRLSHLEGEQQLSDAELRATGLLVLGAGFETTVNLIGNAVALLANHPEQLADVRADPDLWDNTVDEVLRFESPVQLTMRQAYTDTDVSGVPVSAGRPVIVLLGGANRDPEVFPDPHRFDVRRDNANEHLAFSSGIHYCLGAGLARLEAKVALRALYERFPNLGLVEVPTRREARVLRGFRRLPVGTRTTQAS